MKVLKFGGTSVGTVASLTNVKRIVESRTEPVIVVVSALGGITDMLIATARKAVAADKSYRDNFEIIRRRHYDVIDGLVAPALRPKVESRVEELLGELSDIYKGLSLIRDLSSRTLDIVVSYGERLSSFIISHIIADAELHNSLEFIKTVDQFGRHVLDAEATHRLVNEQFADGNSGVIIAPGFIATDAAGNITNLGRGGSDYTAAILAAELNAEVLEIWTDVDGFMSADPRIIKNTYVIPNLSFIEAMELCNFGAKVIYPPTIYPVFHKNIPIYIKNTFNPGATGTRISDDIKQASDKDIKGISSINDTCLISVSGLCMVGVIGVNARIFNALARNGVSVFLVSQAALENTTSFAVRNADAATAIAALKDEFAAEIETGEMNPIRVSTDLATIAIVGDNMRHEAGIAGKLSDTLDRNGIDVIAFAHGASETTISFVVEIKNERKALSVIHDSFFLSDTRQLDSITQTSDNINSKHC